MSEYRLESDGFVSLAEELLTNGNRLRFQASGISMLPYIYHGDILEIKPLGDQVPRLWDIVLCKIPSGNLVAHRVVGSKKVDGRKMFLIKGDSLVAPDGYVGLENMLGIVDAVIHDGEYKQIDTNIKRMFAGVLVIILPQIWRVRRLLGRIWFFHRSR